jgi:hypothetical protein
VSALTALAMLQAVAADVAQPIATVRHTHLAEQPMVVIPLAMAGEANAPLAVLLGTSPERGRLLVVVQPRNRDQRFAFAARLAELLLPYLEACCASSEVAPPDRSGSARLRAADAPQLLVPNAGGVGFLRLFGRSTRFRRTDGPYPVQPPVPVLGRWLTFLAERAEHPGSSMLLAMTDVLGAHWATGQSSLENSNLATLLAWIDPPDGLGGAAAARVAEDPGLWPPAGPVTDPEFDNAVLAPAITAYEDRLADPSAEAAEIRRAYDRIEQALLSQLEPTWRLMWRGVALLRGLPAADSVATRWAADRDVVTDFVARLADGAPPQPRRDGAVAAARRLHRLERALVSYTVQRAYDDPLVMAEYRLTGEAFVGTVVHAQPRRIDASGQRRVLRPWITVLTDDRIMVDPAAGLASPARPAQRAKIVAVSRLPAGTEVVLELSGGMGRTLNPPAGSVPEQGEVVCYTTLTDGYTPPGRFPEREETPWTHGGPPVAWSPDPDDADEAWS